MIVSNHMQEYQETLKFWAYFNGKYDYLDNKNFSYSVIAYKCGTKWLKELYSKNMIKAGQTTKT